MNVLLANLLLALTWVAMSGSVSAPNLLLGYAIGYVVLMVVLGERGRSAYGGRTVRFFQFLGLYAVQVLRANLRVAYDVVTPRHHMEPGIVAMPLDARTDLEILLVSNLITMTPGTLSLDVSDDRRILYVHGMFVGDPDRFVRELKADIERPVLRLMR